MAQDRVQRWLARHGAEGREATSLLRARLDARRRGESLSSALIGAATAGYVAVVLADWPEVGLAVLYRVAGLCAAIALAAILGLGVQGRRERRIGQSLTRRVAHPQALSVGAVVGRGFVAAAVAVFGAGVLAGLTVATGASDPYDRGLGLVLLGALGVFVLIGLVGLIQVVRRPAIADDEQSLMDDLVLRREDALGVVLPYSAFLAVIAAVQSRSLAILSLLLGYALVSAAVWFIAYLAATHATARAIRWPGPTSAAA
jgi:hypothetical protein